MIYVRDVLFDNNFGKTSYLNNLPVVKYLSENKKIAFSSNVTFFVGENGTGKSTLLEAIAVAYGFNPEGGSENFNFSTEETHSELWKHLTLGKVGYAKDGFFLRAESLYNAAKKKKKIDREPSFDPLVIESYGGVSLHKQSHGESFLAIVKNRFFGNGFYILDEPEAALSPMKQLALMSEIYKLTAENSQFIIATHSPILTAFPGAQILELSGSGIRSVDYKETEHYKVTREFLNDPERMLYYLLEK